MTVALMGAVYFVALRNDMPRRGNTDWPEVLRSFLDSVLSLVTPIIIIAGIFGGLFTPTEAGVAASAYALFLSMVVYREVRWSDLPAIMWETLIHTIRVMFVIASAGFFGWLLIQQRIPNQLVSGMLSFSDTPWVVMAIIVATLLILGMFLEGIAVIVLTVPLFLPVVNELGVDPIQFGVIMIMCSMVGLLTPPVGMVLFAVSSIAGLTVGRLSKAMLPYLLGIVLVLLAVVCIPQISTWLPYAVMGR